METKRENKRIDMIGKKFNEWTVDEYSHNKGKVVYYHCTCSCGNKRVVKGANLRSGLSKRCNECGLKESHKKNTGVPLSEERKQKISEAKKGIKLSPERIEQMKGPQDHLCDKEFLEIDPTREEGRRGLRIRNTVRWKKNNAKHPWNITDLEAAKILVSDCHYCGSKPNPYNGIDRVDNKISYEIGNVVPCCKTCNFAKHTMSESEFFDWISRVSKHNNL